jgi:uncharacterized membrane protein HdeD (DUF308 family)
MTENRVIRAIALRGVLAIVLGLVALLWPGVTVLALAVLFGVYAVINGVGLLVGAARRDGDGGQRVATLLAGALGIVVGVLALVWPTVTVLGLVILVGVWALLTGAAELWAAAQLRGGLVSALIGVASIVAGVLLLMMPGPGALALALTIGVYGLVVGVLMLLDARRLHRATSGAAGTRMAPARG